MHVNDNQNVYRDDLHVLIRKNSIYILIERSIAPLISFLVTIYIIRKLSVSEFGIYNILLAVMGFVGFFSSLGLPYVFRRYIPEFYQKRQIAKLKKLVQQGLLWRFLLCVCIIFIILLFSNQLGKLFKFDEALGYFTIFSIGIVFYLESELLKAVLTSIFHHKKYVISQIAYVLFRASILCFLLKKGKGLIGLLIAESVAFGFLFILLTFYYKKSQILHSIKKKTKLPIKRLVRFGGFSYFSELGAQILEVSTDFFIISAFLGPAAVGIYAFANRVMTLATRILPHFMLVDVIRPAFFTRFVQDKDPVQLNKMFNFLSKIIAFFVFPLVTGIIVLGDKLIIYVFDPKYLESSRVLLIMAAFTALNFFMFPLGLVLQSIEQVQIIFFSKIFAIYNLVANLLVVKTYGIIGIALVTGSAVLFKNLFCYLFARRYTRLVVDFKGLGIITINSLLMGLIIYPVRKLVVDIPSFIVIIVIGALTYFIIAHFNKTFSNQERNIINKILPKPIFVF